MNITLTNSSFYPFAAVQVCPSVIDFPGNLHIHATVVHHVHGPLLRAHTEEDNDGGKSVVIVQKMLSLLQRGC